MSTGEDSEESLTSLTDDEQSTIINANENYDDDDDDERRQYSQEKRNEQDFIPFSARGAPPDELQATHVNHYHDLDRLTAVPKDVSITRASQAWLSQYGLAANGLTLKDLLTKGKVSLPTTDKSGRAIQHISFDSLTINDFECRLHTTIETVSNRIRWLLQDSRKVFGVVQGARVLVILDFSYSQASFGRGEEYHKHLLSLIDEQLVHKEQIGFIAYGTEVDALWKGVRDVNSRSLDETRAWLATLKSAFGCTDENCTHMDGASQCVFKTSGGSNLLKALRRASLMSDYDTLLLVVGSLPDQNIDIIADYTSQLFCGEDIPRIHAVSYDCSHHLVNALLKTMTTSASTFASIRSRQASTSTALVEHNPLSALQNLTTDIPETIKHTYHCYSREQPHQIYNSTDIRLLVREIQRSYDLLSRINEMRHGALGSAIISIENELTLDMAHYPQSKFLPRPPNHEQPLRFSQHFIEQSPIIYARQPRSLSAATTNERMSSIRSQDKSSSVRFNDSVSVAGRSATPSHKSANSSSKTRDSSGSRQQTDPPPTLSSNNPAVYRTSADWLCQHGLYAKKLTIFQVLGHNAYAAREDYIPILRKTVTSQIYDRSMIQVDWHDGTTKNVHVDLAALYDYQKRLKKVVELYEQRMEWLCSSSRKIFGNLVENNIIILVDCCQANRDYIIHIQHSLRLLLEQQLFGRRFFNIIAFGTPHKDGLLRFKPTMVQPNIENLQLAWQWVLRLNCGGTRNLLNALRAIYENEEERKHHIHPEGIYLLTSGVPDQTLDVCCAYVEECNVGRSIHLHTILFNIDDYYMSEHGIQSSLSMTGSGRWANATKTAEFMRALAKHSGGRFLWFRETGTIESDDIKLLQNEIEKACQFSEQAANLVETVKSKRRVRESDNANSKALPIENTDKEKRSGPLVVRPTLLSAARQHLNDSSNNGDEQHWRPTSTNSNRNLIPEWPEDRPLRQDSARARRRKQKAAAAAGDLKQESFYIDGQHNTKLSVLKTDSTSASTGKKSVRKYSPGHVLLIPTNEDNEPSHAWLRKHSLVRLKLDLHKMVSGPECRHDTITVPNLKSTSSARYCSVFPSININGSIRHLQLRPRELDDYRRRCEGVLRRYYKRMQWLLNGSRLTFSTITHKNILILVDTSGSMEPYLDFLKKELATLVWEQLFPNQIQFNFIQFNDTYQAWRENLIFPTEDNCHEALAWISTLKAHGNTCSERVLRYAFDFHQTKQPIDAIYYVSDGKPDHSTTYLLEQVRLMNTIDMNTTENKRISINTISFCCQDLDANYFLKSLAHDNNGRYHRSTNNSRELHLFMHRLQEDKTYDLELDDSLLPELESDDLKYLLREIVKARLYLKQAITFRSLYNQQQDAATHRTGQPPTQQNGQTQDDSVLVGPARVPMSEAWFNKRSSSVFA
ncbi:unnamed protein product [Adineta ricciae]|uniref:VWFA domain-containing protein n=1 Tax=Adineta ricciae TaxID=249248 RepID=A0A814JPG4_ADIRI|nr:unnamed protein product [Adineta ricciae]